ncbi:MAG: hypothetical protein ACYSUV_21250, partial [Planctomycetota bacterium]
GYNGDMGLLQAAGAKGGETARALITAGIQQKRGSRNGEPFILQLGQEGGAARSQGEVDMAVNDRQRSGSDESRARDGAGLGAANQA